MFHLVQPASCNYVGVIRIKSSILCILTLCTYDATTGVTHATISMPAYATWDLFH